MSSGDPSREPISDEAHRQLAVDLFNRAWALLEKKDRSPSEEREMLHAAHASRHHWGIAGTPLKQARGEWQVSRVHAALGFGESSLYHARCYAAHCADDSNEVSAFDRAFAFEGLARARIAGGDHGGAGQDLQRARTMAADIVDDADRDWLLENLDALETMLPGSSNGGAG